MKYPKSNETIDKEMIRINAEIDVLCEKLDQLDKAESHREYVETCNKLLQLNIELGNFKFAKTMFKED